MIAVVVRRSVLSIAALALALSFAPPLRAAGASCADWLERDFWKQAAAADVSRCLAAGAKVDARDKYGTTPLHRAAYWGRTEAVEALLDAGAEADARTAVGMTPLHRAARGGQTEAVRALLDAGAEVDARDKDGATPVHLAIGAGRTETAMALLDAGADNPLAGAQRKR